MKLRQSGATGEKWRWEAVILPKPPQEHPSSLRGPYKQGWAWLLLAVDR